MHLLREDVSIVAQSHSLFIALLPCIPAAGAVFPLLPERDIVQTWRELHEGVVEVVPRWLPIWKHNAAVAAVSFTILLPPVCHD